VRTGYISTASLIGTTRTGLMRMQTDVSNLNKEITTGTLADPGLTLGAGAGRAASLHIDNAGLDALITSNGEVSSRLQQTQSALDQISSSANSFLQQLLAAKGGDTTPIQATAASSLDGFISDANTSDGQNYLFAGINTAIKPLAAVADGPQTAIAAAFQAKFGMAPTDPGVSSISAADMNDFLDNQFSAMFDDPAWGSTWSSASDQTVKNRISPTETVETSVSANQPAMRKLAMAYSMVAELGTDNLNSDARQAVLDKAISVIGDAVSGLTATQQNLGATQNRVTAATTRLTNQQDILQNQITSLEGVDPSEAKVKLDSLSTQIEMSYSLTAKLLQMSILNYV